MNKKRIYMSILITVLLSSLLVSLQNASALIVEDAQEDVFYIVDSSFNSVVSTHPEIDIVSIEVKHQYVIMTLREEPTSIASRTYVVDICWEYEVTSVVEMDRKNHTHCVYSSTENYGRTWTFKPDGSDYGVGTTPNAAEVSGTKITWYIDSFDIEDPDNPTTILAYTHYVEEPVNETRKDWYDFYPQDYHTYETGLFGLETLSVVILIIPIGVIIHIRKKIKN